MKYLLIITLFLSFNAFSYEDIDKCNAIESLIDREACFDKIIEDSAPQLNEAAHRRFITAKKYIEQSNYEKGKEFLFNAFILTEDNQAKILYANKIIELNKISEFSDYQLEEVTDLLDSI